MNHKNTYGLQNPSRSVSYWNSPLTREHESGKKKENKMTHNSAPQTCTPRNHRRHALETTRKFLPVVVPTTTAVPRPHTHPTACCSDRSRPRVAACVCQLPRCDENVCMTRTVCQTIIDNRISASRGIQIRKKVRPRHQRWQLEFIASGWQHGQPRQLLQGSGFNERL